MIEVRHQLRGPIAARRLHLVDTECRVLRNGGGLNVRPKQRYRPRHLGRALRPQQQALLMLKLLAQGEADIAAGRLIPQEEVFAKLRERFTPDA